MNTASTIAKGLGGLLVVYLVVVIGLGWWWSREPAMFDAGSMAVDRATESGHNVVTGYTTTSTLIHLAETLLRKDGGYLSNDMFPPGVAVDNMPNWEFGVLQQIRDMGRAMRIDLSRSQSQSQEDPDLGEAEGKFFFDNSKWWFPQSEDVYQEGIDYLNAYLSHLADPTQTRAQFYARADNLRSWLNGVETRLGSLSQRLSMAAGKQQLNVDLAGAGGGEQSTDTPAEEELKTGWFERDDVFYEARGQTFALIHMLKAIEVDFAKVLADKNALVSLQQIIRELQPTQDTLWSPMILNGTGFGMLANHSLVMASHVSRANAGIIDLRSLLADG